VNHDTQFNVDGTRSNFSDDVVVRATPQTGSDFAPFVTSPVSINFTVNAFEKVEIPVEVLCFEEAKYTSFGFAWFKPIETTVREMVFFGDFCTKFYLDYSTSDYGKQVGGVKVDMPAIFRIDVHLNGNATPAKTYTNGTAAANWGVGSPVVVKYSDKPGVVDNYEFKLYILVKVGTGFEYKYMNSWLFKDNEQLVTQNGTGPGLDGVYDFVLGNCNALQADFAFAPYMNLPETSDLVVGMPANTGRESYLLMNLTNFKVGGVTRSGFDLETGSLPGFCINKQISIGVGTTYNVNVYGTLLSSTVLPAQLAAIEWDKINWLVNHLDRFAGYKWYDLQNALWKLENPAYAGEGDPGNGVPAVNFNDPLAMASKMFAAATANGDGYVPLPGGWAAVATVNSGTNLIQALFTIVDP
jgi:hypothetical protein